MKNITKVYRVKSYDGEYESKIYVSYAWARKALDKLIYKDIDCGIWCQEIDENLDWIDHGCICGC